jgi:uncharacterized protein (DUF58 family)
VADLAGAYVGARPGSGLAFAELRPYEPGDDVRHMDWNVTARQGRPYVRRFAEERALTVWLIVDISASLRFGPEGRTKADRVVQAAALLATAALQSGDRAGLALVSDRVEAEIAPGSGPRQVAIRVIEPREETIPPSGLVDLVDAETGIRRTADFGSRKSRDSYAQAAALRGSEFRRWCATCGITGLDLPTAEDPLAPLVRFFIQRARRRGGP